MKRRRHDQTAAALEVHNGAHSQYADLSQPASVRVVQGDNQPSSPLVMLFGFFVMSIPIIIFAVGVWLLLPWPRFVIILVLSVGTLFTGPLAFIVANGDFVAWREIARTYKNEALRMDHIADLELERLDMQREANRMQHEEEMKRIGVEQIVTEIVERLRIVESNVGEANRNNGTTSAGGASSPQYVPATVSPARQKVLAYLLGAGDGAGLYTRDGHPDPRLVDADGRIKHRAPWSARGGWDARLRVEAEDILRQSGTGNPPIIHEMRTSDGHLFGYALNVEDYPTRARVIRTVGLA